MKQPRPRKEPLHVRLSDAAKVKLERRAEREKRPLASLLAILLEEIADQEPDDPADAPAPVTPPTPKRKASK